MFTCLLYKVFLVLHFEVKSKRIYKLSRQQIYYPSKMYIWILANMKKKIGNSGEESNNFNNQGWTKGGLLG